MLKENLQNEKFVSTAEGMVDQQIQQRFFADANYRGVFVDVGAARPDYLSVNALYRNLGWDVIAIEPNPEFCKLWKDRGLNVLQYACGESDQDDVDFSVVDSQGQAYPGGTVSYESFSSLKIKDSYKQLKSDLIEKKIKVKLRKLDTILEKYRPKLNQIDMVSVDTEGWELEVLNGLNFKKYRPRVLIVENLLNDDSYRTYMLKLGYLLWKTIYPNDVYVRAEMLSAFERNVLIPTQNFIRQVRTAINKKH